MLIFARTVKWRVPGRVFFRRLHRCTKVEVIGEGDDMVYRITKVNGVKAHVPYIGTEMVFGRDVVAPAAELKAV